MLLRNEAEFCEQLRLMPVLTGLESLETSGPHLKDVIMWMCMYVVSQVLFVIFCEELGLLQGRHYWNIKPYAKIQFLVFNSQSLFICVIL